MGGNIKIRHNLCGAQATWGSLPAKGTSPTLMGRICAIAGSDCPFQTTNGRFQFRPGIVQIEGEAPAEP